MEPIERVAQKWLVRTAESIALECLDDIAKIWLLEENTAMPGGDRLKRAMLNALRSSPGYSAARKCGWHAQLLEDMTHDAGLLCRQRNKPNLQRVKTWISNVGQQGSMERNFSRFAIACHALGLPFSELFAAAAALPAPGEAAAPAGNLNQDRSAS